MSEMKIIKKFNLQLLTYIVIAVSILILTYYSNVFSPKKQMEKEACEALDFKISLNWYINCANFELFFSKYIITKWIKDKKNPSKQETYEYIKSLNLDIDKDNFADSMSIHLELYDSIKVYYMKNSLLMISPSHELKKICFLHKIKNESIVVMAFLPLQELLNSSKSFSSPKEFYFYKPEEIKDYYPGVYKYYSKWVLKSQADELIQLYKSDYDIFVKKWAKTESLLDFKLFSSYYLKHLNHEQNYAEETQAFQITALDFVLEYFRKNHNKIEAFIKELEKNKEAKNNTKDKL